MTLDFAFFAAAIPAVLISAASKGGFGGGAGFASAPLLALAMPPAQAVGLLLPLLMLMDLISLPPYWRKWEWRHSLLLMAGGIPGTLLGWWVFGQISADGVRLFIGLTALGFVALPDRAVAGLAPAAGQRSRARRRGCSGGR